MSFQTGTQNTVPQASSIAVRHLASSLAVPVAQVAKLSKSAPKPSKAVVARAAETSKAKVESQERFLDVGELLEGAPEDFVFEEGEGFGDDIWEHEKRFVREAPSGAESAPAQVKGALDPTQADILSAYSPEQGFKEITVEDLAGKRRADPSIDIIDVRTSEEFAGGHIGGAQNVPLDRLSAAVRAGEVSGDRALTVICAKGGRSAQACVRLSKVFKFEDVTNVTGGMTAWAAADLPVDH